MAKKLKIGFVIDDTLDRSDGVQTAVLCLGRELESRGHEISYIVAESPISKSKGLKVHQLASLINVPFNGNSTRTPKPVSEQKINEFFKENNFDILHIQMPYSPLFGGRIISLAPSRTKLFGTFHILPYSLSASVSTRVLGRLTKNTASKLTKVYAVSEPAKVFMKQTLGLEGQVLPNPIDYEYFSDIGSKVKQVNNKIVFVGRFEKRKGVLKLAEAVKILYQKRQDFRLVMCGTGPSYQEIVDFATENKLPIDLPGFVTEQEKAIKLGSAEIAIYPSSGGESFGIVLTEAMAAGSGITLGGDNPGYSSVLDEWPETLFDAKNIDSIVEIIEKFLDDKDSQRRIGEQQHKNAEQYDVKKIATELLRDYRASLGD